MTRNPVSGAMMAAVRSYQIALSPLLGSQCRFSPSCSQFMIEALGRHGPVAGLWLGTKRICRCNPWHEGGFDPVP